MQLGCIGDDFTGSSDLAKGGIRTVQDTDVSAAPDVQTGVVALKSRSTVGPTSKGNIGPVAEALVAHRVITCPAFPGTGHSLFQGQLYVIDPGAPSLRATPDSAVAQKSGRFGGRDFFAKAYHILAGQS